MSGAGGLLAGIDIGGTKAVAVLARGGQVIEEVRLEGWTRGVWKDDLATLAEALESLLEKAGVPPSGLSALGVSAAGPLDPQEGVVLNPPNLPGWERVPVRRFLSSRFVVPVRLENDANAAALAEWRYGAGRGARNFAYLTMSTGVGAGLILDEKLYSGTRFQAGEVGHMPVVPNGLECVCGLRGCLEAYTGGAALARRLRADAECGACPTLLELAGGRTAAITPRTWVEAIRGGDRYALQVLEEYIDPLATGLAIIVMAFDVERIILGTIVQQNPDLFLAPLRERLLARVWSAYADVELRAGELGLRLPAYAALCVAELGPAQ